MSIAMRLVVLAMVLACAAPGASAVADTSHEGWPKIDGVLLMNKDDSPRPLDARPGRDPFAGQDPTYSCDGVHLRGSCQRRFVEHVDGHVISARAGHNELLGGHGSDTIHAGPWGDVIWGDYKPSGQPLTQRDRLTGGTGRDFMYASHGSNAIAAGAGNDWVKAHFGRGAIDCGKGDDTLYLSRRAKQHYAVRGCERISHVTLGY